MDRRGAAAVVGGKVAVERVACTPLAAGPPAHHFATILSLSDSHTAPDAPPQPQLGWVSTPRDAALRPRNSREHE